MTAIPSAYFGGNRRCGDVAEDQTNEGTEDKKSAPAMHVPASRNPGERRMALEARAEASMESRGLFGKWTTFSTEKCDDEDELVVETLELNDSLLNMRSRRSATDPDI